MPILKYFTWFLGILALLWCVIDIAHGSFPKASLVLFFASSVFGMSHPNLHILHDRVRHVSFMSELSLGKSDRVDIYFQDIEFVKREWKKIFFVLKNGNTKSYQVHDAKAFLEAIDTRRKEYFASSPNTDRLHIWAEYPQ